MSDQNQDQNQPQDSDKKEGRGLQERIDQITAKRREAERTAENALADKAALETKVAELSAKIDSLSRPASPDPAPQSAFDRALAGPKSPAPQGQPDINEIVKGAVQEALAPIVEGQRAAEQEASLLREQHAAFQEAATDLPGVKVTGSQEQALFDQIWQSKPALQADPQGPALVIQAVKGILADVDTSPSPQDGKKIAASPPTPSSPRQRIDSLPNQQSTTQAAMDDISTRLKARKNGDPNAAPVTEQELDWLLGAKMGRPGYTAK